MVMRKKGNDHQTKKFLIVKQSLLVNTLGNNIQKCIENFVENIQLLILGHKGLSQLMMLESVLKSTYFLSLSTI